MKKQKPQEKINRFEKGPYKLPLALQVAAAKARKEQPELITVTGRIMGYVHLD